MENVKGSINGTSMILCVSCYFVQSAHKPLIFFRKLRERKTANYNSLSVYFRVGLCLIY